MPAAHLRDAFEGSGGEGLHVALLQGDADLAQRLGILDTDIGIAVDAVRGPRPVARAEASEGEAGFGALADEGAFQLGGCAKDLESKLALGVNQSQAARNRGSFGV